VRQQITHNGKRLAAVPEFMFVSPELAPHCKTKVQNIFCCSSAFGQLKLLLISEIIGDAAFCLPA